MVKRRASKGELASSDDVLDHHPPSRCGDPKDHLRNISLRNSHRFPSDSLPRRASSVQEGSSRHGFSVEAVQSAERGIKEQCANSDPPHSDSTQARCNDAE